MQSTKKLGAENGYNIFALMLENSPRFGWFFILIFCGCIWMAIHMFNLSRKSNRSVLLSKDLISAPKSFYSPNICNIKYADILSAEPASWFSRKLIIHHTKGKLIISQWGLGSDIVIDELYIALNSRMRARRRNLPN